MRTIQMTIDKALLSRVDALVQELNTTRSAFIREALEASLDQYRGRRLEERDAAGYRAVPPRPADVAEWDGERVWGMNGTRRSKVVHVRETG